MNRGDMENQGVFELWLLEFHFEGRIMDDPFIK